MLNFNTKVMVFNGHYFVNTYDHIVFIFLFKIVAIITTLPEASGLTITNTLFNYFRCIQESLMNMNMNMNINIMQSKR